MITYLSGIFLTFLGLFYVISKDEPSCLMTTSISMVGAVSWPALLPLYILYLSHKKIRGE